MKGAFCIFCDDVRQEISGKLIYVGVYVGEMVLPTLPATLSVIHIVVSLLQGKDDISNSAEIIITLPGGKELRYLLVDLAVEELVKKVFSDTEVLNFANNFYMTLPNLDLVQEGRLKVDVEVGGQRLRAGSLKVRAAPSSIASSPGTPPLP